MSASNKRQRSDQTTAPSSAHQPNPLPLPSSNDIDFSTYHHVDEPPHPSLHTNPPLPIALWGVDPLFFSAPALFIGCILQLPGLPSLPASTTLHGRPLVRCTVVGVVVGRIVKEAFTVLHVDDSSGVLRCKVWTADSELRRLAAEARLGACVRCVGRMHEWQGVRELNVEWVKLETDCMVEMLHWMECMQLYDEAKQTPSRIKQRQRQQRGAVT